jgi:hypothetical protein
MNVSCFSSTLTPKPGRSLGHSLPFLQSRLKTIEQAPRRHVAFHATRELLLTLPTWANRQDVSRCDARTRGSATRAGHEVEPRYLEDQPGRMPGRGPRDERCQSGAERQPAARMANVPHGTVRSRCLPLPSGPMDRVARRAAGTHGTRGLQGVFQNIRTLSLIAIAPTVFGDPAPLSTGGFLVFHRPRWCVMTM